MSYHLALAICQVPKTLWPEDLEEVLYRAGALKDADSSRHGEVIEEVWSLDYEACEEIHAGLVDRGFESDRLADAERTAVDLLAARWLSTAIDTLLLPLVELTVGQELPGAVKETRNRRTLPYDVRDVVLDGNRYLMSGTITSADANESFGLVKLLDASGVLENFKRPSSMVSLDGDLDDGPDDGGPGDGGPGGGRGWLRCPECGYEGDKHGGFSAIGDALVTAYLNRTGSCVNWRNAEHYEANGYREVLCDSCGTDLGDLTPDDLVLLEGSSEGPNEGAEKEAG